MELNLLPLPVGEGRGEGACPAALTILYRGSLSSCNYDCHYCPFAKRHETAAELRRDREALSRFTAWVAEQTKLQLSLMFTPWGEALVRPWYQETLVQLSRLSHVRKVAIQTNLSCDLDWLAAADRRSIGLWCTYHPTQTSRPAFLAQCRRLDELGIGYSVGMVGLREAFDEIAALRHELPQKTYLWINAFKDVPSYYAQHEVEFLANIDPLFRINNTWHASLGERCLTGETVLSVDGDGNIRRCHFISQGIGNIYDPSFTTVLCARACTNATCGCHIGYVHMPHLAQYPLYGDGLLERIPREAQWTTTAQ